MFLISFYTESGSLLFKKLEFNELIMRWSISDFSKDGIDQIDSIRRQYTNMISRLVL